MVELVLRESLWTGGVKTSVYAIWEPDSCPGPDVRGCVFVAKRVSTLTRSSDHKSVAREATSGLCSWGHSRCNHGIRNVLYIGLHVQSTTFSSSVFRVA